MTQSSKKALIIGSVIAFVAVLAVFYIGNTSPEVKASKYIKRGIALYERSDYDKARIEYKNAERLQPTNAEISFRMGQIDEVQGDFKSAFKNYKHAEQQNPAHKESILKLAYYYMMGEAFEEAQKRIETVLASDKNNIEAHALTAALKLRQKKDAEAEKEANFALEKDPANVTATTVMVAYYLRKNDSNNADKIISSALLKKPNEVALVLLKAMICEQKADLAKIDETYQTLFRLQPKNVRFHLNLATIYQKAGKIDEAVTTLDQTLKTFPDNWDIKHYYAQFLYEHRGIDAAENAVRAMISQHPDKEELTFWLADFYVKSKQTDKAAALLQEIIAKAENDKEGLAARTTLARLNYIKGDKDVAKQLVATVLEKDPTNREALFARANISFDEARYQEAITDLRSILRANPKDERVFPVLAETLLAQGHVDLAIDTMNQLMDVAPTNTSGRVRLAQMYYMNGNTSRADDLLNAAIKTDPTYPIAWETKARFAIHAKDFESAKDYIHHLDGIEDQHLTALFLEGTMLETTGKTEEAITKYTQVIIAAPTSPLATNVMKLLIEISQKSKKLDKIIALIESLNPETPFLLSALGDCHLRLGHKAEAATAFDKAITAKPNDQSAFIGRAILYAGEKKTNEALALLDQAAQIVPRDIRATMLAADILSEAKRHDEALALYDKIILIDPNNTIALNNWGSIIADYYPKDVAKLEKARQRTEGFVGSKNPLLLDTLAWIYYRQGNFQQAQVIIERSIAGESPTNKLPPEIHYHYGAILMKTGHVAAAKKELQKATPDGVSYIGVEEAKKLLKRK